MTDVVSPEKRSRMMSGIRGANTKPEIQVRQALYKRGFRYRLHKKDLPGKPDMVLGRYKTVIFVHGCFWHAHECKLFKWPKSNTDFWREKITGNKQRDKRNIERLLDEGWRVIVVWECALRGKKEEQKQQLFNQISTDIKRCDKRMTISYAG